MNEAVFQIGPFDRNLAQAIGTALRRYALGCIEGTAITAVRIPGAAHEYVRLPGVNENPLQIIENLRQVVMPGRTQRPAWFRVVSNAPGEVTAGDFSPADGPPPKGFLAEVEVCTGIGYRPAEENRRPEHGPGTFPVGAVFSPVRRAWFELAGDVTETTGKLSIETNGWISPQEALRQAAASLLSDLRHPFEKAEFDDFRGEFTSHWLAQTRATTLANLIESGLLFGGDPDALENVDVCSRLETGDVLDNPQQERFVLSVRVSEGASPRQRLDGALAGLRQAVESAAAGAKALSERPTRLPFTEARNGFGERRYSRICPAAGIEDLLAVQRNSFSRFIAGKPAECGLDWLLRQSLNVDGGEAGKLELVGWSLGEPSLGPGAAKASGGAYAMPLRATLRVRRPNEATVEQDVLLGELPRMTDRASFIVNGRERICVGQLVLAPGVYFEYRPRYQSYKATIVPHHGVKVLLDFGRDGVARVGLGGGRPVDAETLLRALGWSGSATDAGLPPEIFRRADKLSEAEARQAIGRALSPDAEDAEPAFAGALKDELAYGLGDLGRQRLNRRVGTTSGNRLLEPEDLLAVLCSLIELRSGRGDLDDLDHAKNLVVRSVGESLFAHVHLAFQMVRQSLAGCLRGENPDDGCQPDTGTGGESLGELLGGQIRSAIQDFFLHNPLVRDLDTTNNLAMLAQARQVTRSGPGGLDKRQAGLAPRYVHPSHYGRLCVIDTPEGDNIGLLRSLSLYARVDEQGFILAPYLRARHGKVTDEIVYLLPAEEDSLVLAAGDTPRDGTGRLTADRLVARKGYDYVEVTPEEVEFVGVSPHEILGAPGHSIPFIEFDDPNRALMGANMARQAVRILKPEPPIVATGYEDELVGPMTCQGLEERLTTALSDDTFCIGPWLGAALSPGRNVLVGFVPWEGYNFEDGYVISQKLLREEAFTSVHQREFEVETHELPEAEESFTRDVPGEEPEMCLQLDERGIVRIGSHVESGDVLVGKARRDAQGNLEDASLRMPEGNDGCVIEVAWQHRGRGFELPPNVRERVKVVVAVRRTLKVGDKLANRHGSKGVVARILAQEDMPCLADGTPLDLAVSPLGVPSRMNIGQLMEAHVSLAARSLGLRVVSPPLNGASPDDAKALLREAGLPDDGRLQLYDGRTGKPFDQPSTVGLVYWRKLVHMVDDAFQARSTGDYDPVTQQPVAGRKRQGGQKFGKMEIWALQSHGAAHNLREFLSIKADDAIGRERIYEAIVRGEPEEAFRAPESANLLLRELRAVGLDARFVAHGRPIDPEQPYDVNDVDEVQIAFAPPDTIRSWSGGEVTSETAFDEAAGKPVSGGLFCERIFGPLAPNRCACGKLRGEGRLGETCAECGAAVLDSHARFRRMGHIELAVPVLHPWIRALDPNPLCAFLGLDRNGLDEVVYCRKHVVVDPKGSDLRRGQLLDEAQYRAAREKFGYECQARMGAEAVAKLAQGADFGRAKEELLKAADPERRSEAVEAAALLESLRRTTGGALPGILEAIPVLPAGLRPSVRLGGAQTATSDLNELYERVVRRNNRLKALAAMKTPGIMLRDEQRLLQEAVDALFGNGYRGHSLRASREVALTALSDRLKGPKGRFIQCLAGKRVDYSARSVIAPGTFLRLDECAVPKELALELFRPFVVGELLRTQAARSRRQAERLVDRCRSEAYRALKAVIRDKVVLLVRAPSLHKYNVLAFRPVLTSERVIRIHPNVTIGFNADYDGDQMTLHVPLSEAAQEEARRLLMASGNLFGTASSAMMNRPSQEIILGCTTMTLERRGARGEGRTFTTGLAARNAWKAGEIEAQARIRVRLDAGETETTAGRILFNEILPDELEFANEPVGGAQLQRLIAECYVRCGVGRTAELVDAVKEFGFHFATVSGVSIWRTEPCSAREAFFAAMDAERAALRRAQEAGEIDGKGRYLRTIDLWSSAQARLREQVLEELARLDDGFFPISMMVRSGARGSQQQMLSLFGACGLSSDMFGRIVEFPVRECMMTGMGAMSYFLRANGARAGLAMTALRIAPAGDLMRRIVEALEDVMVVAEDCGTTRGLEMSASAPEGRISPALAERAAGRILAQEVRSSDGTVLFGAGQELSEAMARRMEESGVRTVSVRSPMTCEARGGVCARCYGHDLGRKRLVEVGAAAGITAAVSLGEPLTQLTMRSFHLGHGYPYSWIAQGRPEQDIKYSSGFPRLEEVFEMLEKRRAFGPALDGVDERPSAQSVLDRQGEEAAQQYLLRELMHVYAESGVRLNSKHYEIAVRQLMSFVEVEEPGDTGLATGQRVQRDDLAAASEAVKQWGGRPATAKPILLPITEVALRAGSFLAASASWQTVKVLTKAALRRDTDRLKGMRENIILGRLIRPAGAPRG